MASKKRKVDIECRIFNEEWRWKYFFAMYNNKAVCLICNSSVAVLKEYNLRRHFETKHASYAQNLNEESRKKQAADLVVKLTRQKNVFLKQNCLQESVTEASFLVAKRIAQCGKPFAEGEFVKKCMLDVCDVMCPEVKNKFENISLSRQTIARRIEDLNANINNQLLNNLKSANFYAIALDESCDVKDTAQLLIFIRAITEDFQISEELLSIVPMKGTTKGEDLFREIEKCFLEYNVDWKKLVNVATDGSPNMIGKNIGLIKRIEDRLSEIDPNHKIIPIHCIIHQHALCKNILKIDHVTNVVVKLVNFLRSKGLNHRQFIDLLEELNTSHLDVLYHNKIRWLSLGKVLRRVWDLQEEIKIFLMLKENEDFPELLDPNWICDLAFSLDILTHLNEFNTCLQGKNLFAHDLIQKLKAFKMKLSLFSTNLAECKFDHFPTLQTISLNILKEKVQTFNKNILALMTDFEQRFDCFKKIDKILSIIRNPFSVQVDDVPVDIQLEIINLQCDELLHEKYREEQENLCNFYKQLNNEKYGNLKKLAKTYLVIFSSTYICEQTFSLMNLNKSTTRSRLNDLHLEAVLRIATTSIEPDIKKIIGDANRLNTSH